MAAIQFAVSSASVTLNGVVLGGARGAEGNANRRRKRQVPRHSTPDPLSPPFPMDVCSSDVPGCGLDDDGCNGDAQATCSAGDGIDSRACTCADGYWGTSSTLTDAVSFTGCTGVCSHYFLSFGSICRRFDRHKQFLFVLVINLWWNYRL